MSSAAEAALGVLGTQLAELGWVRALLVAGSLATGDHVPGVSDLDLAARAPPYSPSSTAPSTPAAPAS